MGLEVFIGQPLSVKLVELQKLSEGIGPREAGPGDLPAIQNGMRVATAVTFQNTGSEACWRLAAAAVAAAKPLVCGGNLTIVASVICQASGNGGADGGNGSGTFFFRNAEVAPLFVPKRSRTLFFFLPLDD